MSLNMSDQKHDKLEIYLLSGDLCKSGPGYFASEKSFPSNFAQ